MRRARVLFYQRGGILQTIENDEKTMFKLKKKTKQKETIKSNFNVAYSLRRRDDDTKYDWMYPGRSVLPSTTVVLLNPSKQYDIDSNRLSLRVNSESIKSKSLKSNSFSVQYAIYGTSAVGRFFATEHSFTARIYQFKNINNLCGDLSALVYDNSLLSNIFVPIFRRR